MRKTMIVNDQREKLFALLYQACLDDICYLKKTFSERKVFSYAIYCDSGFTAFGGAACSREGIEHFMNKPGNTSYMYAETFAGQWDYVNNHWECFSDFDALNEGIITGADDGDVDGIMNAGDFSFNELFQFYIDLIIDVLNTLKLDRAFNTSIFEKDMLLGLQFGDADDEERSWIIYVSEHVNSPEWHKKMRAAYNA